jgi:mono/diheme cytochrome c family protein
MNQPRCWPRLTAGIALLPLGLIGAQQTVIKQVPISSTSASDGFEMYHAYCGSCHGVEGRGGGPAAPALKVRPTDLTTLSKYNNGEFPGAAVMAALGLARGSHGTADMPVWGDVFRLSGQDETIVRMRLYNLTRYIESIQEPVAKPEKPQKAESIHIQDVPVSSGGAMYHSYCASCHGSDGRGQGPAAPTLNTMPADLSMLSRNNGGKFPVFKVGEILGRRPGVTAHGSADMPIWGNVFRSRQGEAIATMRINNLIRYLEGMQR